MKTETSINEQIKLMIVKTNAIDYSIDICKILDQLKRHLLLSAVDVKRFNLTKGFALALLKYKHLAGNESVVSFENLDKMCLVRELCYFATLSGFEMDNEIVEFYAPLNPDYSLSRSMSRVCNRIPTLALKKNKRVLQTSKIFFSCSLIFLLTSILMLMVK